MSHQDNEHLLQLGKLGKTFQLAGGIRFYPLGEAEAEAIFTLEQVFIEGLGHCDIREVKNHGKGTLLFFSQVSSIEKAQSLVNRRIYAELKSLPEAANGFYVDDLIGLTVFLNGEAIGTIESIIEAGLQDVLNIATNNGEFMVPLQASYVQLAEDGLYLNNPPEGLLELNET